MQRDVLERHAERIIRCKRQPQDFELFLAALNRLSGREMRHVPPNHHRRQRMRVEVSWNHIACHFTSAQDRRMRTDRADLLQLMRDEQDGDTPR